jgi:glycosyltransferase involved in cell wall biosynthesis
MKCETASATSFHVIPTYTTSKFYKLSNYTQNLTRTEEGYVLGYIGRLSSEKRVDTLLEAIRTLESENTSISAIIVGDGPCRGKLEKLSEQLRIQERIEFTGFKKDVVPYLQKIDIFVLPSESEGSPIALLEAIAAGLPVIVSRFPSLSDFPKQCSFPSFKVGDAMELSRIIRGLVTQPRKLQELSNMSRECANHFRPSKLVKKLMDAYKSTLVDDSLLVR